jgi:hypothetical protein
MEIPQRTRSGGVRLSSFHERWVVGVALALFATGALWIVFHYFVTVPSEFGEHRHPLETWWLRLHGAAAMAFLVVFGTLLSVHIRGAWRLGRNRVTGVVMLSLASLLVVSGYGLYYSGEETLRQWTSVVHWIIGLAALPAMVAHMIIGKRGAAKSHAAPPLE